VAPLEGAPPQLGRPQLEAVEERARYELGLIKQDEVFFQVVPAKPAAAKP